VEGVGVEDEAEEERVRDHRKDVVASIAISIGVTEADLEDGIVTLAPNKREWADTARSVIKGEID